MKKKKRRISRDEWYAASAIITITAGFLAIGYILGMINGQVLLIQTVLVSRHAAAANAVSAPASYYTDTSAWQTDQRADANIRMSYPIDFLVNDIYNTAPSTDWRMDAGNVNGTKILTLTIPKAFQPQSNFNEAMLAIGRSGKSKAVADCLKADTSAGEVAASSTANINGVEYFVTHAADAGAGNLYDSTSYRTVQNGQCYAIEYTIHSSRLGNYPESYHLHQFDKAAVEKVLQAIVGTVAFTK
jgi:hypothetical protein